MSKRVRVDVTMGEAGAFSGVVTGIPNHLAGDGTAACVPTVAGEQPLVWLAAKSAPVASTRIEQRRAQHDVAIAVALAAMNMNHHPPASISTTFR